MQSIQESKLLKPGKALNAIASDIGGIFYVTIRKYASFFSPDMAQSFRIYSCRMHRTLFNVDGCVQCWNQFDWLYVAMCVRWLFHFIRSIPPKCSWVLLFAGLLRTAWCRCSKRSISFIHKENWICVFSLQFLRNTNFCCINPMAAGRCSQMKTNL